MPILPLFLDLARQPVMLVGDGEEAEAKHRLLLRMGATIVGEEADARVAIVAIADDYAAAAAAARLKARGMLVNAVDRPELCDLTLPAIVDRRPLLIAIGTGGASAALAAAVRQRLEALLPAGLGRLAEALHAARGLLRRRFPEAATRRRALGMLLGPGGALDPLRDVADPAGVLAVAGDPVPARIEHVRVASADPDLLTLRDARLLAQADRLFHAADLPAAILDRARADAVRIADAPPALPPTGLSVVVEWAG